MFDGATRISDFLQATSSRSPTPGGGAVTAVVGGLAAAIGEMVLNFSVGKKGLEAFEGELRPALTELTACRQKLLKSLVEDQAAFADLTAAKKSPEGSPRREQAIRTALEAAIRAPSDMASTAVQILDICDRTLNFVNPYLLSDLAICADLAMATARCSIYSVRINLPELQNAAERHQYEVAIGQHLSRAAALIQRVAPRIWERVGQSR